LDSPLISGAEIFRAIEAKLNIARCLSEHHHKRILDIIYGTVDANVAARALFDLCRRKLI
jgi:DNA-binding IscR family transcriptional regulator